MISIVEKLTKVLPLREDLRQSYLRSAALLPLLSCLAWSHQLADHHNTAALYFWRVGRAYLRQLIPADDGCAVPHLRLRGRPLLELPRDELVDIRLAHVNARGWTKLVIQPKQQTTPL